MKVQLLCNDCGAQCHASAKDEGEGVISVSNVPLSVDWDCSKGDCDHEDFNIVNEEEE